MMDTRKVLLLILFQGMVNVTVFAVEEDSTSLRSVYFLTRENVRLKGHAVEALCVNQFSVVQSFLLEKRVV